MKKLPNPIDLFATPKNMEGLQKKLENLSSGNNGPLVQTCAWTAWNLCCKLHKEALPKFRIGQSVNCSKDGKTILLDRKIVSIIIGRESLSYVVDTNDNSENGYWSEDQLEKSR